MAAAPWSYTCLGEEAVAVAGPSLLGEAAGPPPPATLLGEGGGVAAAAFEDRDEEAAAAAAAAFEGEAVAAAGGTAAVVAAGRGGRIILAIALRPWWIAACNLCVPLGDFKLPERLEVVNVLHQIVFASRLTPETPPRWWRPPCWSSVESLSMGPGEGGREELNTLIAHILHTSCINFPAFMHTACRHCIALMHT